MGFAGMGAEMAGSIAAQSIKPFFLGNDPFAREKHWHDFRRYERHWHHTPIYSYGPFDIALWDIAGRVADLPLYKLLGHCREKVPTYVSSMYLDAPSDYAEQAVEFKRKGFHGYKLHPARRLSGGAGSLPTLSPGGRRRPAIQADGRSRGRRTPITKRPCAWGASWRSWTIIG